MLAPSMLTDLIVVLQIFLLLFKVELFKFYNLKTQIWVKLKFTDVNVLVYRQILVISVTDFTHPR